MQGRVLHKNDHYCKIIHNLKVFNWVGSACDASGHEGLHTQQRDWDSWKNLHVWVTKNQKDLYI